MRTSPPRFDGAVAFWRHWLSRSRAPTYPRWISTLDAITAELASDSLVDRD